MKKDEDFVKISKKELRRFIHHWKAAVKGYNTRAMRVLAMRDRNIKKAKKELEELIEKYEPLLE